MLDTNKAGLTLGALLGGWHILWLLIVALHWAQPVVDFIFWIHFIKPVYVVEEFSPDRAAILVAVTAAIGYAFGYCFALLWNRLHRARGGGLRGFRRGGDERQADAHARAFADLARDRNGAAMLLDDLLHRR